MIVEEIFGAKPYGAFPEKIVARDQVVIEKSFLGDTRIEDINKQLNIFLRSDGVLTLEELMAKELGHRPNKGDYVRVDQFELTVEEAGLLKRNKISIRTVF
jgi:CBS domain containing-hemolysin-like protein